MSSESTFGGWLKQRRSEAGVTQEELSNELGFSLALLRKLESAERRPSGQIAHLLAEYFRVPADEQAAFMAFARTGGTAAPATSADYSPPEANNPLAPWRRAYLRQTNLPTMLTHIIGREQEKAAALDHLQHPKTRLLTLTGTPGIGKTRLGLEVASGLVENFEDGVFFVDLAPVIDPDLVLATIARTLGLKEVGDRPFEMVLLDYLRERRMLLFLDNFEQVLDAATAVIRLLEASPWLKVLVTSREALHVRGERRLSVLPLGLPDRQQLELLEALAAYPALALFVERARVSEPEFELTQENAKDIAAICIGLEGVPLAIELAAARVRHFSPKELHSGLGNRLKFLTGGARDLPARHRTLRSALGWSYDLLNPSEQRLFRFAGVFAGGFTAEALGGPDENQQDAASSTFDMLVALADKNLVRTERKTAGPADLRFGLLEAIREYAVEQLEKHGETGEARQKHAGYYLSLAERAEHHFTGPQYPEWGSDQIGWMDRLEADLDNIRAALDWFQAQVEAETKTSNQPLTLENLRKGLSLATALRRIWLARGHFTEGIQRLTGFIAKVPQPLPARQLGLRAAYATALAVVGRLTTLKGNVVTVRPLLAESLSIATELGDKPLIALILLVSGAVALAQGDYAASRSYQRECLKLYRKLGNKWGAAAVLQDLGDAELYQGNFELAKPVLEESLQLFREVGETFGASSTLIDLGSMAYSQGEYGQARALWQESLRLRQQIGNSSELGYSLVMLGWVELRVGNHVASSRLLKEGLLQGQEMGAVFTVYWGLVGSGALEQAQHQAGRAALFFGAAEGLARAKNIQPGTLKQLELDREIAAARTQLTGEQWDKAWARGYSITFEGINLPEEGPLRLNKTLAGLLETVNASTE